MAKETGYKLLILEADISKLAYLSVDMTESHCQCDLS